MGELSLDLRWGASWKQNNRYHCTLSIKRDYFDNERFSTFLFDTFGDAWGSWKFDKHIHGIEIWFKRKQDMLTFKLLVQTNSHKQN